MASSWPNRAISCGCAHADNPLRDGGQIITHIGDDDARTTTTPLDPAVLDDPGFRFLLQLIRDHRTLIRVSGQDGTWAELDPTTGAVTQVGRTDVFDHIEHADKHWDQHGHPDPARLGTTAGPTGQTIWLGSPEHPFSEGPVHGPPVVSKYRWRSTENWRRIDAL